MPNLLSQFKDLLPNDRLLIGEVAAVEGERSRVVLLDGASLWVRGNSVPVGQKCYVKGGAIYQAAPNLPESNVTIY